MNIAPLPRFEDGLGYLVHHLMYAFRQKLARECADKGYALTSDELAVMMILSQNDGLTQSRLAEVLAKDRAVISRLLNSLTGKKLVCRQPDRKDRRLIRAGLTGNGLRAVADLRPLLEKLLHQALAGVEQQEFDACRDVLRRILDNVTKQPGDA